jgi:hypothetical protein
MKGCVNYDHADCSVKREVVRTIKCCSFWKLFARGECKFRGVTTDRSKGPLRLFSKSEVHNSCMNPCNGTPRLFVTDNIISERTSYVRKMLSFMQVGDPERDSELASEPRFLPI